MLPDRGPDEAAVAITDRFVDAAVAKLDALFGAGYTRDNPPALAAYLTASAATFDVLLSMAAMADEDEDEDEDIEEALLAFEEEARAKAPPAPRGKRR